MPPAAGLVVSQTDRKVPVVAQQPPVMAVSPDSAFAKDAIIGWFRGEFAAANAIIDALCGHLRQLEGGDSAAYEAAFKAIHRRRLNWIPVLQMQKYFTIGDVTKELNSVVENKRKDGDDDQVVGNGGGCAAEEKVEKNLENSVEESGHEICNGGGEREEDHGDESPESEITDTGSEEVQSLLEDVNICFNHEECDARRAQIKMTKGFVAKEPIKGHMVNVVRGLKVYEDIFSENELNKLNDFVSKLRVAGQNGELSGETFVLYNQQMKGNKRELIQLGVPIFGKIRGDADEIQKSYIQPIPDLIQSVIDHFSQWYLIREQEKPNSCIINFFDEGEHSQPFLKPPHLDQPLCTLLLSESTMVFGRTLACDKEGNYKGPLVLSLKEGSLLVMRGNSSDTARHVMCSSENKRASITFFRVRTENAGPVPEMTPFNKAMTLWQPGVTPPPYAMPNNYELVNAIPKWGLLRPAMVMLPPVRPMIMSPRNLPRDGTGVFLPWNGGQQHHRKPAKHLPPRAQRGRFLALPSPARTQKAESGSDSGTNSP